VHFESLLNQLSLLHESNKTTQKGETKQKMSYLSPEMVLKSMRAVQKGKGDYCGKDLRKR